MPTPQETATAIPLTPITEDEFEKSAKRLFMTWLKQDSEDYAKELKTLNELKSSVSGNTRQISYKNCAISLNKIDDSGKQKISVEGIDDPLKTLLTYFKTMAESRASNPDVLYFEIDNPSYITQDRLDALLKEIHYTEDLLGRVSVSPKKGLEAQKDEAPKKDDSKTTGEVKVKQKVKPIPGNTSDGVLIKQKVTPLNWMSNKPVVTPPSTSQMKDQGATVEHLSTASPTQ